MNTKDCMESRHCPTKSGYARFWINGKNVYAHRLVYCQKHGLSLDDIHGQEVIHTCDNPPCINPDHLRLGTHAENMADMVRKGRQPKGQDRANTKLTDADVIAIRTAYAEGYRKPRKLAEKYGVSYYTIMKVAKRQLWSWL